MFIMDDYDFVTIVLKFCYVRFLNKLSFDGKLLAAERDDGLDSWETRGIVLLERTARKSFKASLTLRFPHSNSLYLEDRTGRTI